MKQKLLYAMIAVILLLTGCAEKTGILQPDPTTPDAITILAASPSPSLVVTSVTSLNIVTERNDGLIRLGLTMDELIDQFDQNGIAYQRDEHGNIETDACWISFDEQAVVQYILVKNMPTSSGLEKGNVKEDMTRIYGDEYLDIGEGEGEDEYLYSMGDYSFIVTFGGGENPVVSGWIITSMGDFAWDTLAGLYGGNPALTYETRHSLGDALPEYQFMLKAQKRDDYSFVEAMELVVRDGERIVQIIDLANAGDSEYPESFSIETAFIIEDVNFDGYKDMRFSNFIANANVGYLYWVWDVAAATFTRATEFDALVSPVFDHENGVAYSYMRESASEHHEYAYRCVDGKPVLFRHVAEGYIDPAHADSMYRITNVLVGDEMREVMKVRIDDAKTAGVQRPPSRVEIINMEGNDQAISTVLHTASDGFSFYYDAEQYSVVEADGIVKVYSGNPDSDTDIMTFEHIKDQSVDSVAAARFSAAAQKYDVAEWHKNMSGYAPGVPLEDGSVIITRFSAYNEGNNPDGPYAFCYLLDDGESGAYVFTEVISTHESMEGTGVRYTHMMKTFSKR